MAGSFKNEYDCKPCGLSVNCLAKVNGERSPLCSPNKLRLNAAFDKAFLLSYKLRRLLAGEVFDCRTLLKSRTSFCKCYITKYFNINVI